MDITINSTTVDIATPNLAGADTVHLYYSFDCGDEQMEVISIASISNNSFTWNRALQDGVHFFRLIITGDINATELKTVVKVPQAWYCDVPKKMDWEYLLQLWALEELTCDCYPEHFCTIYRNIESLLDEC